jgi:hypothetical protein
MVVPFHWPDEVEIAGVRRSAAGRWWRFSGGFIRIGEKIKERTFFNLWVAMVGKFYPTKAYLWSVESVFYGHGPYL